MRIAYAIPQALLLWFVVATLNQYIAGVWLSGYELIKRWAYSIPFGATISAAYFLPSALASIGLIYKLRHDFRRAVA